MKTYVIVAFALFAVFSTVCADSSEEVIDQVKSKHVKKLLSKNKERIDEGFEKLEAKCPGVTEKLKAAVKSFVECDDKVDDTLTICQAIQTSALNCTAPLLKVVDDCLPAKSKGLPTLGVKSLVSLADFLCKQTGESLFELANPCVWEDVAEAVVETEGESGENHEPSECEQKIQKALEKVDHDAPTKQQVCEAVSDVTGCIHKEIEESKCKNQKTKDVVKGVYDALVAPCSHINEA